MQILWYIIFVWLLIHKNYYINEWRKSSIDNYCLWLSAQSNWNPMDRSEVNICLISNNAELGQANIWSWSFVQHNLLIKRSTFIAESAEKLNIGRKTICNWTSGIKVPNIPRNISIEIFSKIFYYLANIYILNQIRTWYLPNHNFMLYLYASIDTNV